MKLFTKPVCEVKGSVLQLNNIQVAAVKAFKQKVRQGHYKMQPLKCLCGAHDDILIAKTDRYGIKVTTVVCKNCGLMRIDPYYDTKSLAKFYSDDYRVIYSAHLADDVEHIARHFQYRYNTAGCSIANAFVAIWGGVHGKHIYEIGCGAGGILACLKDQGAIVAGCDYGLEHIQYGRSCGLDLYTSIDDLALLPKPDGVIMNHSLEHIPDPLALIEHIKSMFGLDFILFCDCPDIDIKNNIPLSYFSNGIMGGIQNAHCWWFSAKTLTQTLARVGFVRIGESKTFKISTQPIDTTPDRAYAQQVLERIQLAVKKKRLIKRQHLYNLLYRFLPFKSFKRKVARLQKRIDAI